MTVMKTARSVDPIASKVGEGMTNDFGQCSAKGSSSSNEGQGHYRVLCKLSKSLMDTD